MDFLIISKQFKLEGEFIKCEPYGNGHINKTYLLTTNKKAYILQQINNYAFKDVDLLMNNIVIVTNYIKSIGQESMTVVYTVDNKPYLKIDSDTYFRVYEFVENSLCFEKIETLEMLELDGKAFGKLHKDLKNLDATKLGEVIKDFHNTPKRYENLLNAIKEDSHHRVAECQNEINVINSFKDLLSKIVDGIDDKTINLATTHNDPKINNVLFDRTSGEVRCVIDLDTIMPGSVLYDIGDSFRSLFTGNNEDTLNLDLLVVNYDIFDKFIKGYLSEMGDYLTPKEIELIPYSAFLLTIECGIRFLEDYLRGDVYFHTSKEKHNLIRARTQIRLAQNIYHSIKELNIIINKYTKEFLC